MLWWLIESQDCCKGRYADLIGYRVENQKTFLQNVRVRIVLLRSSGRGMNDFWHRMLSRMVSWTGRKQFGQFFLLSPFCCFRSDRTNYIIPRLFTIKFGHLAFWQTDGQTVGWRQYSCAFDIFRIFEWFRKLRRSGFSEYSNSNGFENAIF